MLNSDMHLQLRGTGKPQAITQLAHGQRLIRHSSAEVLVIVTRSCAREHDATQLAATQLRQAVRVSLQTVHLVTVQPQRLHVQQDLAAVTALVHASTVDRATEDSSQRRKRGEGFPLTRVHSKRDLRVAVQLVRVQFVRADEFQAEEAL